MLVTGEVSQWPECPDPERVAQDHPGELYWLLVRWPEVGEFAGLLLSRALVALPSYPALSQNLPDMAARGDVLRASASSFEP